MIGTLGDIGKAPATVGKIAPSVGVDMPQRHIRITFAQLLEPRIERARNARAAHGRVLLQLLEILQKVLEVPHLVIANVAKQLA
ncbi:hypothetical protein SDC9_207495 [bioreactor metagenome]|uniref:Uncharacterized protein n=1 Tax=bioreactor metagenome TaxID=1076179 RepID=A0A645JJF9_9ZZZZ